MSGRRASTRSEGDGECEAIPRRAHTDIYLFCGHEEIGGQDVGPLDQAMAVLPRGVAVMVMPPDKDPSEVAWPSVKVVAVFGHAALSDANIDDLADAMIQAGVDRVEFIGCRGSRRGPLTFRAVT